MSHPQLLTPERHLVSAKQGLGLPVIVVICGSTRFMDEMAEADLQETAAGRIIVRPGCNIEPVPGLRVFELPGDLREEGDGAANPWRLTRHSGLGLVAFPTREDALRGAREVADLADWTRTPEELRADAEFDREEYVDRILHRTNGLLIPQSSKGAAL